MHNDYTYLGEENIKEKVKNQFEISVASLGDLYKFKDDKNVDEIEQFLLDHQHEIGMYNKKEKKRNISNSPEHIMNSNDNISGFLK